MIVRDLQQAAA